MKKFILPALLSIVLLSSCSPALYKNSYDWVKVNRTESTIDRESNNPLQSALIEPDALNANDTLITKKKESSRNSDSDIATVEEIRNVPSDTLAKTKRNSEEKQTQMKKRVNDGYLTINIQPEFSRGNRSGNLSNEEIGYIWAAVGIVVLLILMAAIGPGQFVNAILLIYFLTEAIVTIVGVIMLLCGIYLLFKGFLTMMDH